MAFAQQNRIREIQTFSARTGAIPAFSKATGSVSMLRFPAANALKLEGADPKEKAFAFLKQNPQLFAIRPGQDVYLFKKSNVDNYGLTHVELQQYYKGIPVFDGTLRFHFNKSHALSSVNGNFIPVGDLNAVPAVSREEAADEALKRVQAGKKNLSKKPLKVKASNLFVFQKGLVQGYAGNKHLVYELEVSNDQDVRELVYLDAHTKAVVEQIEGISYIKRRILDQDGVVTKWKEADPTTSLTSNEKIELEVTGQFYNLMKSTFDYTSFDNKDSEMKFRHITDYPNDDIFASWSGTMVGFYDNSVADDVIAHEWAHAYTQYTTGLYSEWEPGSINEAYSDIWGETFDQINGYMDEGENNALRTDECGSSTRWLIGEKMSYPDIVRDMWNPNCTGTPGKVSDWQYICASRDENFGKNVNYSVLSHAYALLVDCGTYNGQTIKGIGLTKAAHIFWHAQKNYVTKTTGFIVMADILELSASELIGISLRKLSTSATSPGLSGQMITEDDVQQLTKAIAAVELRMPPDCYMPKTFSAVDTLCAGASKEHALFYDDFESGLQNWTVSNKGTNPTWTPRNWTIPAKSPGLGHGKVAFGPILSGGCNTGDTNYQNGLISLISPAITVPAGSTGDYMLAFDHYVAMDSVLDGGNIRYRIDGGAWILVPAAAFTANPYNAVLRSLTDSIANPLQGQPAFTDADIGPEWGHSRIDLSLLGLRDAGQKIQFRWDLGTIGCGSLEGWYIDNVTVYSCTVPSIQFLDDSSYVSEADAEVKGSEACLPYVEKIIRVKLNAAPSAPVTVTMNTPAGNAIQGETADYTFSPATFVLKEDHLLQDITVRIYDDAYVEGNENIVFSYTFSGGNAFAETTSQRHLLKIIDNDAEPLTGSKEILSEDFSDGFPAGWKIFGGYFYPYTWGVVDQRLIVSNYFESDYMRGPYDETVETRTFNTSGLSNIKLSFYDDFYFFYSDPTILEVEVWDGGTWQNLLKRTNLTETNIDIDNARIQELDIPAEYANSEMKVRFHFFAQGSGFWSIDDVKVTAGKKASVANAVSKTSDSQYLGPNATAYFYDSETGNLQAKIKNLTAHDYGCTTVKIDRAGKDTTSWVGGYHITRKTFLVTPTNNNPAGNYEITLYYKASELPNFSGPDIVSMGKSEGRIGSDNTTSNSTAEIVQRTNFGSDYAYTATFHTGFSGFGLSDAPAGGPLPVTLSKFEGKKTAEGNLLSWTTTSEVDNAYFLVERSSDGRVFTTAGKVEALKGSQTERSYRFLDTGFAKGISYYRLKQVDLDGKSVYSRILALDAATKGEIKLYPNPVQKALTLELPDASSEKVQIKLVNAAGQQVFVQEQAENRNGKINIDIEKLPAGIYQVIVTGESKSWVLKMLKM
ncbi:hypothetical protein GCM10011325_02830 [Dyadobacter sediminis]|nr:hypothetical protein GCM10011325_02830 [Dyadobacter sediminis]